MADHTFLFHGADSFASRNALTRWEQAFAKKHDALSITRIEADDGDLDRVMRSIASAAAVQGLFGEARLVVVKRLLARDTGNTTATAKAASALLDSLFAHVDPTLTLVFWEERRVAETNAVVRCLQHNQTPAAIKEFSVATADRLLQEAEKSLAQQEMQLEPPARRRLVEVLIEREKVQRLEQRLKAGQPLQTDDRSWWLSSILETAALLAQNQSIGLAELNPILMDATASVGVFELVNAIERKEWPKVEQLLERWRSVEQGDSAYFGLVALLRRTAERGGPAQLPALLAEFELLVKNGILPASELFWLMVQRLQQPGSMGILSEKTLRLLVLARAI